jgi:hypothetical protein
MKKLIIGSLLVLAVWASLKSVANSYEDCAQHEVGVAYRRLGTSLLALVTGTGRSGEQIARDNAARCPALVRR